MNSTPSHNSSSRLQIHFFFFHLPGSSIGFESLASEVHSCWEFHKTKFPREFQQRYSRSQTPSALWPNSKARLQKRLLHTALLTRQGSAALFSRKLLSAAGNRWECVGGLCPDLFSFLFSRLLFAQDVFT